MSGGSYGYIYCKCAEQLTSDSEARGNLEQIGLRLKELGFEESGKAALVLKDRIEEFMLQVEDELSLLHESMRAVEMIDSCDSTLESERDTLEMRERVISRS